MVTYLPYVKSWEAKGIGKWSVVLNVMAKYNSTEVYYNVQLWCSDDVTPEEEVKCDRKASARDMFNLLFHKARKLDKGIILKRQPNGRSMR